MSADDVVVRLEKVTKVYQQDSIAVHALCGVSLEIHEGDFAVLVGPSGSGKTTLLNVIGGLDTPTAGRIWVAGTETGRMSKSELSEMRLRKIGFVFQEFNLVPVLSAVENVEFVMLLQGVGEAQRSARSYVLLKELGLEGLEHRRPNELSGGQQQRVAVARAIAAEPIIVLPDEPTANLDSKAGGGRRADGPDAAAERGARHHFRLFHARSNGGRARPAGDTAQGRAGRGRRAQ